jgi:hypothetical protein
MPLSAAVPVFSPARYASDGRLIKPEIRQFSLGYGTCDIEAAQEGGCHVPLTLAFSAPCAERKDPALATGTIDVRGVEATVSDRGLRINTADFSVDILPIGSTPGEILERATRVAEKLAGANEKASHIDRTSPFTAFTPESCGSSEPVATITARSGRARPTLAIDSVPSNRGGPCAVIDRSRVAGAGVPVHVAICLTGPEQAPLSGGLASLRLVFDYSPPLTGLFVGSDLNSDLNGNPDWNEAVSPGAFWDCNVLNAAETAPRSTSPAWLTCDAVGLLDQPFGGAEHLATFSFAPSDAIGTSSLWWNPETTLNSEGAEMQCDGVNLACDGASIIVGP